MACFNLTGQVLSAATTSANGADLLNVSSVGATVVVDITAVSGTTPTLTVTVQGKDEVSGKYYTILASAALSTVSTTVLQIGPGLTAAANTVANAFMPRTFRVISTIGGTTPSFTATIGVSLNG